MQGNFVAGPHGARAGIRIRLFVQFRSRTVQGIPRGKGVAREKWIRGRVHDLKHDGKLYESQQGFLKGAKKINEYLKAWNAADSVRSLHHNLEWIHNLDIEYDASTFDFDPFEPQPDGMNTIFPEWIPFDGTGRGTSNSRIRCRRTLHCLY